MAPLSTNLRRTAALAILALLALLVVFGIAAPIMEKYDAARGTSDRLAAALARAERSDEDVAALEAELAKLKQRRADGGEFLLSANEALAAAELQNRIKSAVEAAQGELRSTQILAVREEGQFRQAAVRGQIVVKLKSLQRIFHQFESASPLLFLDNVEIRARGAQRNRSVGDDPLLEVRFDLCGYLRRPT
jgi:type II secretion system (T2SS) protein M